MTDDDVIRIPLRARDGSVRAWAIVDREDADLAELRWHALTSSTSDHVYACKYPGVLMHRIILLRILGGDVLHRSVLTDHKNGNGLDNRRANLRPATRSQNGANRGPTPNTSSVYLGVCRHKGGGWQASATHNGATRYIGYFASETEAAIAYNKFAAENHGEYARLNVVEGDA